jgi:sec-independent protein translocase protein TatB
MFNIGFSELLILGVIGLLVLGPEQLPEVAKKLAKLMNELKRAKDEIMSPVDDLKRQSYQLLEEARRKAAQVEYETQQALSLQQHQQPPHQGDIVPPPQNLHQEVFQPSHVHENSQPQFVDHQPAPAPTPMQPENSQPRISTQPSSAPQPSQANNDVTAPTTDKPENKNG